VRGDSKQPAADCQLTPRHHDQRLERMLAAKKSGAVSVLAVAKKRTNHAGTARCQGQWAVDSVFFRPSMEAFLVSTGIVALAEIGDKTQLLAIVLAARFRKPVPIILAILVATVLNHAIAGALGVWLSRLVGPTTLEWVLGVSFLLMAAWMLIPDKYDESKDTATSKLGVFGATLVAFFLLEMGDKTQIATVALAARYDALAAVVAGTTLGMMIANVPAVYLGEIAAKKLNMRLVRSIAAAVFAVLGVLVLTVGG
jgi:putative Ca2+/H+ antiporter (TMEM165/GDT1 family)